MQKTKYILGALILVIAGLSACSEPTDVNVNSNSYLSFESGAWKYRTTYLDSNGVSKGSYEETEQQAEGVINGENAYRWDSVNKAWKPYAKGSDYTRSYGTYGDWSNTLAFTSYTDSGKHGALFGLNFLDSGSRYWVPIPDEPGQDRVFTCSSLQFDERGFHVGGTYVATLDPKTVHVSVPSGAYDCIRLTLKFDGQIGVGAFVFLHTIDTLYLARGAGIVRHTLTSYRMQYVWNGSGYDSTLEMTDYHRSVSDLVSHTTQ